MKAERNKTIDFLPQDAPEYLARCLRVAQDVPLDAVCDRTICGDTFQVAPHLPRAFADLLIVDPPYNLTKEFAGGAFRRMTDANYAAFTRAWIELLLPLLKPNASIYVCCDWRSSPIIGLTLKEYFRLQNRITWQREKGRGAQHNWKNGMEDIWFATRTDDYTFHVDAVKMRRRVRAPYRADGQPKDWEDTPDGKFRNTYPSNFWDDISVPYWSMPENTAHPTQKPEKLLAKLILASSDPGGIVLDPFSGSGSTAVTARKLGRRFVAIERSEQYCAWAEKRLEMLRRSVEELPNVEAELYRGLLADYAREKGGHVIVKGLRNATDFDLEYQMAAINRGIWAELETVFLPASVEYQHFSSTMVREMIRYRQPLEKYVPRAVAEELKQKTE